jgi:hypothetical protein
LGLLLLAPSSVYNEATFRECVQDSLSIVIISGSFFLAIAAQTLQQTTILSSKVRRIKFSAGFCCNPTALA